MQSLSNKMQAFDHPDLAISFGEDYFAKAILKNTHS